MNFIAPEFLYALGFLAIPILIHLFNFRRYKTVQFTQVRFLKSVKKQTQSTSRLKHIIVLICRCLAIAALVFAFAQPIINKDEKLGPIGKKGVIVYLDNSFSMQSNAEAGNLLDLAKSKALAISEAYSNADRFQLHTTEFSGKQLRWLNKEAFINQIQNVDFSPLFRDFTEISSRLNGVPNENELNIEKYIICDLQKSSYNTLPLGDSSVYYLLSLQSQNNSNVWLERVESFHPFHLANLNESLELSIQQHNNENVSYKGSLYLNNQLKSPFSVELKEDSIKKTIQYVNPDAEVLEGKLILKDYPVVFDDTFFFSYPLKEKIKVLHIFDEANNQSISSLFKEDSLIQFNSTDIQQIDFSAFKNTSLIILDEISAISSGIVSELTSFMNNGGSIIFFPSIDMKTNEINPFLRQFGIPGYQTLINDTLFVKQLNLSAGVFENVFEEAPKQINLPVSYSHWRIRRSQNNLSESILSFANSSAFLEKYEINSGSIYLSSVNLNEDQSNFGRHALFVPILYNIALQAVNKQDIAYMIGDKKITIRGILQEENPIKLSSGRFEIIPKQIYKENSVELFLKDDIKKAGFYQILRGDQTLKTVAFNFNRKESDLTLLSAEEFEEKAKLNGIDIRVISSNTEVLSTSIKNLSQGKSLWKYFVLLALVFIGLEILFLRILKT